MSAPTDVTAYARALLMVPDLEVKLAPPPPGLTDDPDGVAAEPPDRLARPPCLVPTTGRAKVPPLSGMADPAQRARLLHGWFNHELQAVELFAWALLVFPDAPSAFRRGLLELLADEQRHARLYLGRLAGLGHGAGDFPVSAYLWDKRGSMHTPLRFVAAMCLVFEQANLDHTVDAAQAAREAGDGATADVLDRVHHEERRHVAFGLRWLERLAPDGRDPVDVWQESLDWPLRPALARGPVAHREPRVALDMPPEWLALVESARR